MVRLFSILYLDELKRYSGRINNNPSSVSDGACTPYKSLNYFGKITIGSLYCSCVVVPAALHEEYFSSKGNHETSRMKTLKQDVCRRSSQTG